MENSLLEQRVIFSSVHRRGFRKLLFAPHARWILLPEQLTETEGHDSFGDTAAAPVACGQVYIIYVSAQTEVVISMPAQR